MLQSSAVTMHIPLQSHMFLYDVYVTLKDQKRSFSKKNDHVLWHYRNSYNAKLRVVAVFKQPQRIVT